MRQRPRVPERECSGADGKRGLAPTNLLASFALTQDDNGNLIAPNFELYVQSDASGASFGVKGDVGEGERILADLYLGVHNGALMLRVHRKGFAAITYSIADVPPAAKPGVFLSIDGGVVHGVTSNVPGIEVRAFDRDLLEEDEERKPLGEIIYDVTQLEVPELEWERYRREELEHG